MALVEIVRGNILDADVEALVNTVNCVGVMGRGIALQFREAFPDSYHAYKSACDRGDVRTGHVFVTAANCLDNPRYVIHFPTKVHWRTHSRLEYIEAGLESLVDEIHRLGIRSIAVPPLGCGLGGLSWAQVRPRIEHALAALPDMRVLLFEPAEAPDPTVPVSRAAPPMTTGRAIILALMQRYLAPLMDISVSLLEIHKLMYLMQEAGEDLRLRYVKAPYGPYAENLRHALSAIEGHFISSGGPEGDNPTRQFELASGAAEAAFVALAERELTSLHLARVTELIQGFETPFGMELLTTVHWVTTREGAASPETAIEYVYAWNPRKRMFTAEQIRLAWQILCDTGWLPPAPAGRLAGSVNDAHRTPAIVSTGRRASL